LWIEAREDSESELTLLQKAQKDRTLGPPIQRCYNSQMNIPKFKVGNAVCSPKFDESAEITWMNDEEAVVRRDTDDPDSVGRFDRVLLSSLSLIPINQY
jgi:hypothetical protein